MGLPAESRARYDLQCMIQLQLLVPVPNPNIDPKTLLFSSEAHSCHQIIWLGKWFAHSFNEEKDQHDSKRKLIKHLTGVPVQTCEVPPSQCGTSLKTILTINGERGLGDNPPLPIPPPPLHTHKIHHLYTFCSFLTRW